MAASTAQTGDSLLARRDEGSRAAFIRSTMSGQPDLAILGPMGGLRNPAAAGILRLLYVGAVLERIRHAPHYLAGSLGLRAGWRWRRALLFHEAISPLSTAGHCSHYGGSRFQWRRVLTTHRLRLAGGFTGEPNREEPMRGRPSRIDRDCFDCQAMFSSRAMKQVEVMLVNSGSGTACCEWWPRSVHTYVSARPDRDGSGFLQPALRTLIET